VLDTADMPPDYCSAHPTLQHHDGAFFRITPLDNVSKPLVGITIHEAYDAVLETITALYAPLTAVDPWAIRGRTVRETFGLNGPQFFGLGLTPVKLALEEMPAAISAAAMAAGSSSDGDSSSSGSAAAADAAAAAAAAATAAAAAAVASGSASSLTAAKAKAKAGAASRKARAAARHRAGSDKAYKFSLKLPTPAAVKDWQRALAKEKSGVKANPTGCARTEARESAALVNRASRVTRTLVR
jgi:hypothetical protein